LADSNTRSKLNEAVAALQADNSVKAAKLVRELLEFSALTDLSEAE